MATEKPEDQPETQPTKVPPADTSTPQWAIDLKQTIEELPGKLRASVTDQDKSSIAEAVHGLFERSGAFADASEPPKPDENPDEPEKPEPDAQPEKKAGLRGFAARHFGEG